MEPQVTRFHWADYVVFALALIVSASVGVFHGWRDRKQKSVEAYLMAGRKMHFLPVSVSLFVSWMSAISFLGDPVEVYHYGAIYWVISVGYILALPVIAHVFVPIYYEMKLTSAYQFIEARFEQRLRPVMSVIHGCSVMVYLGIALYAPSVALSQVSGMSVWVAILTTGFVCSFYTTLGGIKAVLWADTLQMFIMLAGLLVTLGVGVSKVGGMGVVWETAAQTGRLNFNTFNPSPFLRSTFWTYLIGGFFRVLNPYAGEQYFIQRYCTARSLPHAKGAIYGNLFLLTIFSTLFVLTGLLMVAYFQDCDPLANGAISQPDQMLPLFVLEVLSFLPGLSGLFLACIYSAALSTLSSGQNALSTMCLHDVIIPLHRKCTGESIKDSSNTVIARILCVLLGAVNIAVAFVILQFSDQAVFQISLKVTGTLLGPIIGVFITGALFSCVNTLSVVLGSLCCLTVTLWLGVGSMFNGTPPTRLPVSTVGCHARNSTAWYSTATPSMDTSTHYLMDEMTTSSNSSTESLGVDVVYQLSPLLYPALGSILTALFSLLYALLTRIYYERQRCGGRGNMTPRESVEMASKR